MQKEFNGLSVDDDLSDSLLWVPGIMSVSGYPGERETESERVKERGVSDRLERRSESER